MTDHVYLFRQDEDLSYRGLDINDDNDKQARRKVEASQGKSHLSSWVVSASNLNAIQAPKKAKAEDDEDTKALKEKQKADAAALAAAKDRGEHCYFSRLR